MNRICRIHLNHQLCICRNNLQINWNDVEWCRAQWSHTGMYQFLVMQCKSWIISQQKDAEHDNLRDCFMQKAQNMQLLGNAETRNLLMKVQIKWNLLKKIMQNQVSDKAMKHWICRFLAESGQNVLICYGFCRILKNRFGIMQISTEILCFAEFGDVDCRICHFQHEISKVCICILILFNFHRQQRVL